MGGTMENPYAGQGPVLLDIGGDVGALVVVMPPETDQVVRIAQHLLDDVPPQVTGIAHGDYRIGNLSFDREGNKPPPPLDH